MGDLDLAENLLDSFRFTNTFNIDGPPVSDKKSYADEKSAPMNSHADLEANLAFYEAKYKKYLQSPFKTFKSEAAKALQQQVIDDFEGKMIYTAIIKEP